MTNERAIEINAALVACAVATMNGENIPTLPDATLPEMCNVHSPEMVQRRGDVCARLVRLWMRRERLAKKSAPQYYMQDSRGYVGNAMLFWAKGGHGYTTHLEEAQEYTAEQAKRMHKNRRTDKPIRISAARAAASTQVNVQRLRKFKAKALRAR